MQAQSFTKQTLVGALCIAALFALGACRASLSARAGANTTTGTRTDGTQYAAPQQPAPSQPNAPNTPAAPPANPANSCPPAAPAVVTTPATPTTNACATTDVVARISNNDDIGTQDGAQWDVYEKSNNGEAWIGSGEHPDESWLGLRFRGINLPASAQVISARLILNQPAKQAGKDQWIRVQFVLRGELDQSPRDYRQDGVLPSSRALTSAASSYKADESWKANSAWSIDITPVLRELSQKGFGRGAISLVAKGKDWQWGRKFFQPSGAQAPTLSIRYVVGGPEMLTRCAASAR